MKFQSLVLYPNLYPSYDSYGRTLDGNFGVLGKYDTDNIIRYTNPSLENIQVVENTTFRFILAVKESEVSEEYQYFTSETFYDDLKSSVVEYNPYFINNALNENLFVKISLDNQIRLFNELKLIDLGTGVKQNQNLFLVSDNSIDYVTLVQYIDWLVGKVNPLDDENNGVIPAEKIADYEIGEYNEKTGEFISNESKTQELANRLQKLEDELAQVEESIAAVQGDMIEEPKKRKTSALEVISLGLSAVSVFQGVTAASKAIKVAKEAKKVKEIATIARVSTIKPIPPVNLPAPKVPDFSKLFPGYNVGAAIPSAATGKIVGAANQLKSFANQAKNVAKSAGKFATKAVSATGTALEKSSKFVMKLNQTPLGGAISRTGAAVAVQQGLVAGKGGSVSSGSDNVKTTQNAKFFQTKGGQIAATVGKQVAQEVALGVAKKIIGAAAGPIGAAVLAGISIVKFFVGKAKEKKEYKKQKAEYDKVSAELNRLLKRKEDLEFEIESIVKTGKLTLDGKPKGDDRFSSTQKYFQNIGKSILERQNQQVQLAPAEETITQPVRKPSRYGRTSLDG